ncbi:MAG: hypothetical protein JWR09_1814 [Mucilaginibacter sp.]|nr:hypothetical protein [Mucilaginibacter sp.]
MFDCVLISFMMGDRGSDHVTMMIFCQPDSKKLVFILLLVKINDLLIIPLVFEGITGEYITKICVLYGSM